MLDAIDITPDQYEHQRQAKAAALAASIGRAEWKTVPQTRQVMAKVKRKSPITHCVQPVMQLSPDAPYAVVAAWGSVREASAANGLSRSHISEAMRHHHMAGGCYWRKPGVEWWFPKPRKRVPIIASGHGTQRQFESIQKAADALGLKRRQIEAALKSGWHRRGWQFTRVQETSNEPLCSQAG